MSLRLRQAVSGRPSAHSLQNVSTLALANRAFVCHTSSSNVIILDHQLQLLETLRFSSALPHRAASSSAAEVQGVQCNEEDGLIIAWSSKQVVIWSHVLLKTKSSWIVHSTLSVSAPITSLDFRKGNLVLSTSSGIELWKTDAKSDIVVWDRLWERSGPSACSVIISPSISHIAWYSEGQRLTSILTLDRKGMVAGVAQEIRHPREISWIGWRNTSSNKGDAYLYTITTDTVFRVYSPVLDDPTWFQLLSTLDARSFRQRSVSWSSKGKNPSPQPSSGGTIIPLDAETARKVVDIELQKAKGSQPANADLSRKLQALQSEEVDLVLWIGNDGAVALSSIINVDRKPPTLLKSLSVGRAAISARKLQASRWRSRCEHLFLPSIGLVVVLPTDGLSSSLAAFNVFLPDLLVSSPGAVSPVSHRASEEESVNVQLSHNIDHFVRTPNGRGLLALTKSGEIGVWYKEHFGKSVEEESSTHTIVGKGQWTEKTAPRASAVFAKGRAIVFYANDGFEGTITLQHLDERATSPTPALPLPQFELELGDDIAMLIGVSDIDDGYSNRGRRTQSAIIMAASKQGHAWVWKVTSSDISTTSADTAIDDTPKVVLLSHYVLPVEGDEPYLILPVDPMGWHQSTIDWKNNVPLQDMILTVSKSGVLEFWSPELGHHYEGEQPHAERHKAGSRTDGYLPWKRTGIVRTGRENVSAARCSSRKKTVLVCAAKHGSQEMTIWDSNVSEFSTGLELTHKFEAGEVVQDLDWTTTSDLQSVLAVGFAHKVTLVCEQRLSYTENTPGWAPFLTLNLEQYTTVPISDSIWLAGGSLAIGCGNQIYLFSRFLDRASPLPSPAATVRDVNLDVHEAEDIFQLIAWQNGPLWDYHPTVLAQCILWDKVDLVKRILVDLARKLRGAEEEGQQRLVMSRLDPSDFFQRKQVIKPKDAGSARKYDGLFDIAPVTEDEDEDEFSPRLVAGLVEALKGKVSVSLSTSEKSQLATLALATLEVERQRRSLDKCGLRYLISIRMAANRLLGQRRTGTQVNGVTELPPKISFRNIVWATHSESQELLLTAATECCENGKMLWSDAKRLGVFLWLKSPDTIKSQLEVIARNRFMADDDRDPTSCSLIFLALGKKKVLHGLWRQAPGHKEQGLMMKFLSNDFELERWKTAAIKNAYALLSKQRFEYAAAFFMLGGCPKDAITVCLRQMNDWQLGYALARAVEGGTDGPIVKSILTDTVLPLAMAGGHRWLATWAFWILGRRDLAVRVLISPMDHVAAAWETDKPMIVGNTENDDPSLLLLFQHLKSKSLQTAKGTSEIHEKTEFDFVLHNARVFFRMGCHSLGLDLLQSWSFDRPFFPPRKPRSTLATASVSGITTPLATPLTPGLGHARRPSLSSTNSGYFRARRPSFMLSAHTRRESMVMDMDVFAEGASEPVTRVPSPTLVDSVKEDDPVTNGDPPSTGVSNGTPKQEISVDNAPVQPKKMGNLMKELKQDVQQGAMEFDMSSFF